MRNLLKGIFAAFTVTLQCTQALCAAPLPPGEYVSAGGAGTLEIKPAGTRPESQGGQPFSIRTIGSNLHVCDLEGSVRDGKAVLDALGETCNIGFKREPAGIRVTPEQTNACRVFCGARAGFEALYYKPYPACTSAAMSRTRDEFLALYKRKQYAQAKRKLAPLLSACGPLLYYTDDADIRNDLAVTLHHLGEKAACRKVLEPWRETGEMSDEEVKNYYPPAMVISFQAIAEKTRTNLRLCGQD
jgi:hypothetical protein